MRNIIIKLVLNRVFEVKYLKLRLWGINKTPEYIKDVMNIEIRKVKDVNRNK